LGSLARKLTKGGLDIFLNFLTPKTFSSNKPLKKARPFSSLVILMRVKKIKYNGDIAKDWPTHSCSPENTKEKKLKPFFPY
jgi:hypothetical protein